MALESSNQPAFYYEPLPLIVNREAYPYAGVSRFDLSGFHRFRTDLLLPLLTRTIDVAGIQGSLSIYGNLWQLPNVNVNAVDPKEFLKRNKWDENHLAGLAVSCELAFSVRSREHWDFLQEYYLALRLGKAEYYLDCAGGMEESALDEPLKAMGEVITSSVDLADENWEEVDDPFPPSVLALSFLGVTLRPYDQEEPDEPEIIDLPGPGSRINRPLVLV